MRRWLPHGGEFALSVVLLVAFSAAARITSSANADLDVGALPDPILSSDVAAYSKELALSDPQRTAVLRSHEAYWQRICAVRDDALDALARLAPRARGRAVSNEALVERLADWEETALRALGRADEAFFADFRTFLHESQQPALERIVARRERERLLPLIRGALLEGDRPVRLDLTQILDELQLPSEQHAAALGVLAGYDRRLTEALREARRAARPIRVGMDVIVLSGFYNPIDPFFSIREQAGPMHEAVIQIGEINRSAASNVRNALGPEHGPRFVDAYRRAAYRDASFGAIGIARHNVEAALAIGHLPEDALERLRAIKLEIERTQDEIADRVVKLLDAAEREYFWLSAAPFQEPPHEEELDELRERAQAFVRDVVGRIHELIGDRRDEHFANVRARHQSRIQRAEWAGLLEHRRDERSYRGSRFLVLPMDRAELAIYANVLSPRRVSNDALDRLYSRYRESFEEAIRPEFDAIRAARFDIRRDAAPVDDTLTALEALEDRRRAALARLASLDREALHELSVEADSEEWLGLALAMRERRALTSSWERISALEGAAAVDLLFILFAQPLESAAREAVEPTLLVYDRDATALVRQREELVRELHTYSEQRILEFSEWDDDEELHLNPQFWEMMAAEMETESRMRSRLSVLALRIIDLNDETLQRLRLAMDDSDWSGLRTRYLRVAFPSLFSDPASLQQTLAQLMEQLSPQGDRARDELHLIAHEYAAAYDELHERMVRSIRSAIRGAAGSATPWIAQRRQQLVMHELGLRRFELNAQTVAKLMRLFPEELIQRTGAHLVHAMLMEGPGPWLMPSD